MNIKEAFEKAENGTLTYDQFLELTKEAKFADLSEGGYVAKKKYEDDLLSRDTQITTLNETITSRDGDLEALKQKLSEAGTDATKLATLNEDFSALQGRYDADTKALQAKLDAQAYEFAVREYAGTKQFTSNAAKRDFISSMLAKNLQMDKGSILGADDFANSYATDNADAFVVKDDEEPSVPDKQKPAPHFVDSTGNNPNPAPTGDGGFNFNFVGVRAH